MREHASGYLRVLARDVRARVPAYALLRRERTGDYRTHRELHPAFYGSFDWHPCVEMHWAVVRPLRRCPDVIPGDEVRAALDALLTEPHLAVEVAFFASPDHRSLERPCGQGWLLALQHEPASWDDADGCRWAGAVAPLADLLAENLVAWLPKPTYPRRGGAHANTAFALSRCLDCAILRAGHVDGAVLAAIREATTRLFAADADYPAHDEPSWADFLSPALAEADLLSRLLEPAAFAPWPERFPIELADEPPAALFRIASVTDTTDGQIAHLHGLNLSRAWAFAALAARLPVGDGDYMVEHWLATYATLLLSGAEDVATPGGIGNVAG